MPVGVPVEAQPMEQVGVDFGTATTLVARSMGPGACLVVPVGLSTSWLPSVARLDGADVVVGEAAEQADADQVIRSVKRAITQRRDTVVVGGADDVEADRVITALLAMVVERAGRAGLPLNHRNAQVRLGCPAMWDGAQRRRLLTLADRAGLPVGDASLVDEPVAAGLAWLSHRYLGYGERPSGRLLVLDMGGGTLDIAVLSVHGGPMPEVTVEASLGLATAGDTLDTAMARDLADVMVDHGIDPEQHPRPELAWALLERAAREAKVRLSTVVEHPVVLPRMLGYPKVIRYLREDLEEAFASQLDGAENLAVAALRAARGARGLDPASLRGMSRAELAADVDHVLLVGGMTRVPVVAARFAEFLPRARLYADAGVPPEEAVVAGLAGSGHERISLNRPGFDLVLDWDRSRRRVPVYDAYSPLFEPWQLYSGYSDLRYERRLVAPDVPSAGDGVLRAVAAGGVAVPLTVDGRTQPGLPVQFGPGEIVVQVSGDGRLSLVDGTGIETRVRVERWPAANRAEDAGLTLWRES
jgi:molecular chaperone DnaK (HSP70)